MWALLGLTVLAAILRFATLGSQSFWRDEGLTVWESTKSLGSMLATIPKTEGHPPIYPVVAWGWVHLFGTGEVAVRSLSALAGIATVPIAYAAGSALASRRAGIAAAAVVAASPVALYYSQEARPYALMLLFASVSFLGFANMLRTSSRRWAALWAIGSALALGTHYFSAFLVVPEVVCLLIVSTGRRLVLAATGFIILAGLPLLALALYQRKQADAQWVAGSTGQFRLKGNAEYLVFGPAHYIFAVGGVAFVAVIAIVGLLRSSRAEQRPTLTVLGLLAAGAAIPIVMRLLGFDYLVGRYVLVLFVPFAVFAALALTLPASGRLGIVGVVALCTILIAVGLKEGQDPAIRREDWRGAARALGTAPSARAIIAAPAETYSSVVIPPAAYLYLHDVRPMPASGARVNEIDIVRVAAAGIDQARFPPAPPGFRVVATHFAKTYRIVRLRSRVAERFRLRIPGGRRNSQVGALLQAPNRGT